MLHNKFDNIEQGAKAYLLFKNIITRGFNHLRLFAFAHNGLKPHCYKKWIASCNDDKNNFIILNLVKSFLTSIKFTFDSLSRKIKNPCLVINKNFLKEDFTMKSKQIIIMLLSFIILFAIGCDNENKTGSGGSGGGGSLGGSQSKSELVGTWIAKLGGNLAPSFTVDAEGNISRKYTFTTDRGKFESVTYTGKVADTFDYPYTVELSGTIVKLDGTDTGETKKGTFIFNSASECSATIQMYNPLERPESRWYDLTETYYKQ